MTFLKNGTKSISKFTSKKNKCCKRIRMELEIGHPEHFVLRMTDLSSIRILCQQPFSKKSELLCSCALVLLCSCARLKLSKEILCSNIAKMITMDDNIILICARLKLSKELLCSNIAKMISMYNDIILSVLG